MKKKYFFKFFLFTVFATLVTFTACKDYDDDISRLESEISNLKGMSTDLTAMKADITAAQTAANNALAKANEALEAAQGTGDAAAVEAAQEAADKAQAKADEVEAKATELEGLVEVLEGKVAALEAMDNASQEDLEALNDELNDLKEQVAEMTGSGLRNLVLIPDYVWKDGATGIALFNQLDAGECGMIAAPTTLRYRVSPTNASEEMIEKELLSFEFNTPKNYPQYRSGEEAPKFTAEFVSLKDGVLTVKAHMATDALKGLDEEDEDLHPQIQLIVPTASGEEVISDWVSVETSTFGVDGLANSQLEEEREKGFDWDHYMFSEDLEDAKNEVTTEEDLSVVNIKYDKEFNLEDVVTSLSLQLNKYEKIALNDYGFTYKFDLNYYDEEAEKDQPIVYDVEKEGQETNQQDFITLLDGDKGTVKSKVYSQDENRTAIGRTPIVRVQLMNDECVVHTAYIKINWTEDEPVVIPALDAELEITAPLTCGNIEVVSTVEWMNTEIYSKLGEKGMTKPEFYDTYELVLGDVFNEDGEVASPYMGDVTEPVDEEGNPKKTTNLFRWVLSPGAQKTTPAIGYIHYNFKGTEKLGVRIKVTVNIVEPTADLSSILLTNYWDNDWTYIKHNVQVPQSMTDDDPDNATFENNINNAFKTTGLILDLGAANEDYADFDYAYFFKKDDQIDPVDGITIIVSEDGKQLRATEDAEAYDEDDDTTYELVASITDSDGTTGDMLAYNEDSDLGKYLLNKAPEFMRARLYLALIQDCDDNDPLQIKLTGDFNGEFDVHFLRPVNIEGEAKDHFVDGVDVGAKGSILDVRGVVRLSDWRNYSKDTEDYYFDPNHENYYDFYGFDGITIDETKIVPEGLVTSGGAELTELPSTIEVKYDDTETADNPNGVLTYKNNGSSLINEFTLVVPVTVNYKWGEVETVVRVLVKPTSAEKSIR